MEKIKGFTILEAVITLTIVCLISLIGTLQLKDYQQKIIFNNSVDRFNAAFEQASRVAIIRSERISIDYMRQSHTMYLQGNKGYHRKLNFDETMEISQIYDYVISSSGMSKPKKIVFSDGKHKKIENIQMAWGKRIAES